MKALYYEGNSGENVVEKDIPQDLAELAKEKRDELIAELAEVDEEIEELFLMEEDISVEQIKDAIRRRTLDLTF